MYSQMFSILKLLTFGDKSNGGGGETDEARVEYHLLFLLIFSRF